MNNFLCERCGYKTSRLSNFKNHLNRKFVCKPILKDLKISQIKKFYNIEDTCNDLKKSSFIPMVYPEIYPLHEDKNEDKNLEKKIFVNIVINRFHLIKINGDIRKYVN